MQLNIVKDSEAKSLDIISVSFDNGITWKDYEGNSLTKLFQDGSIQFGKHSADGKLAVCPEFDNIKIKVNGNEIDLSTRKDTKYLKAIYTEKEGLETNYVFMDTLTDDQLNNFDSVLEKDKPNKLVNLTYRQFCLINFSNKFSWTGSHATVEDSDSNAFDISPTYLPPVIFDDSSEDANGYDLIHFAKNLSIPHGVGKIHIQEFENCELLENLFIPESVEVFDRTHQTQLLKEEERSDEFRELKLSEGEFLFNGYIWKKDGKELILEKEYLPRVMKFPKNEDVEKLTLKGVKSIEEDAFYYILKSLPNLTEIVIDPSEEGLSYSYNMTNGLYPDHDITIEFVGFVFYYNPIWVSTHLIVKNIETPMKEYDGNISYIFWDEDGNFIGDDFFTSLETTNTISGSTENMKKINLTGYFEKARQNYFSSITIYVNPELEEIVFPETIPEDVYWSGSLDLWFNFSGEYSLKNLKLPSYVSSLNLRGEVPSTFEKVEPASEYFSIGNLSYLSENFSLAGNFSKGTFEKIIWYNGKWMNSSSYLNSTFPEGLYKNILGGYTFIWRGGDGETSDLSGEGDQWAADVIYVRPITTEVLDIPEEFNEKVLFDFNSNSSYKVNLHGMTKLELFEKFSEVGWPENFTLDSESLFTEYNGETVLEVPDGLEVLKGNWLNNNSRKVLFPISLKELPKITLSKVYFKGTFEQWISLKYNSNNIYIENGIDILGSEIPKDFICEEEINCCLLKGMIFENISLPTLPNYRGFEVNNVLTIRSFQPHSSYQSVNYIYIPTVKKLCVENLVEIDNPFDVYMENQSSENPLLVSMSEENMKKFVSNYSKYPHLSIYYKFTDEDWTSCESLDLGEITFWPNLSVYYCDDVSLILDCENSLQNFGVRKICSSKDKVSIKLKNTRNILDIPLFSNSQGTVYLEGDGICLVKDSSDSTIYLNGKELEGNSNWGFFYDPDAIPVLKNESEELGNYATFETIKISKSVKSFSIDDVFFSSGGWWTSNYKNKIRKILYEGSRSEWRDLYKNYSIPYFDFGLDLGQVEILYNQVM